MAASDGTGTPDVTGGGPELRNNLGFLLLVGLGSFGSVDQRLRRRPRTRRMPWWSQIAIALAAYNPLVTIPVLHWMGTPWVVAAAWGAAIWVGVGLAFVLALGVVGYRRAKAGRIA
jgi:hypothetical protein